MKALFFALAVACLTIVSASAAPFKLVSSRDIGSGLKENKFALVPTAQENETTKGLVSGFTIYETDSRDPKKIYQFNLVVSQVYTTQPFPPHTTRPPVPQYYFPVAPNCPNGQCPIR